MNMPPTTTVANGRCTRLPMPWEIAPETARRQRRHEHRAHALLGTAKDRLRDIHTLNSQFAEIGDVETAIHHGDAEQRTAPRLQPRR